MRPTTPSSRRSLKTAGSTAHIRHLATAMFVAQMALACIACIQAIRRRDTRAAPLFLTLLGAFLFLSIWETRARYFFQFMMILLCAGAMFETPSTHTAQKA